MANSWDQLRKAGAEARARLVAAAAKEWRVPAASIAVANGILNHLSGKSAPFGQLPAQPRQLRCGENQSQKRPPNGVISGSVSLAWT